MKLVLVKRGNGEKKFLQGNTEVHLLAMPRYSHLFAIYTNLTYAAFGGDRDTEVLSVGNEEIVDGKPILLRKFFTECKFSLMRILRFDIPPTIGNPVNVGIHTDARFFVPQGYYQIRRLAPHTVQFQ